MEQIEDRICVEAALKARHQKISLLVIRAGLHPKQIASILHEAGQQTIPIKYVFRNDIDARVHGKIHGGIIVIATPKPPIAMETLDSVATFPIQSELLYLRIQASPFFFT